MQILVLGLCRTGTQSLADALEMLGVGKIYHMREVNKNNHVELWIRALEAKFEGKGKVFGREEWDVIFDGYEGLSDIPAAFFPTDLIHAYPAAKIILTTRPEDAWYDSVLHKIWHSFLNPPPDLPATSQLLFEKGHAAMWNSDFPRYGREAYRRHNEEVRRVAREEGREVLEMQVGDGWETLCGLLGLEVPEGGFPWTDALRGTGDGGGGK